MSFTVFDDRAPDYDAWYDSPAGSAIFAMEVACLKSLLYRHRRPYLEVGVGSGRFAQALGIEYGIDPSRALLQMSTSKGIQAVKAFGEQLPFADGMFGGVLVAFTLCFVADPLNVLQECRRVLAPEGGLVLGLILKGSPWADPYLQKGEEGHPIYSKAHFSSKSEVEGLLQRSGFKVQDYRSVLSQPPGQSRYRIERPVAGYRQSVGFVAIDCGKQGA